MEKEMRKYINIISENFINEKNIVNESSLSRIWQHIENDGGFGVISPYRK